MGRLWLALALLIALASPAFAAKASVPPPPQVKGAHILIGDQRTSTGRYAVALVHLEGHFDNDVGGETVLTGWPTPATLDLDDPDVSVPPGTVDIVASAVDGMGTESTHTTRSSASTAVTRRTAGTHFSSSECLAAPRSEWTRHDQVEVTAAGRDVALRSSPKLVERARSNALPRVSV